MADSEHEYRKVVRQVAAAREVTIVRLTRENEALRAIVTRLAEGERSDEGHTALRDAALALKEPGR